jgi:pyridoxal 5'-phosphate synthase pdxT subunit
MTIGILAVQGAFVEHQNMLNKLGVHHFEIRQPKDLLIPMDGLILPGGESTAMRKLLDDLGMFSTLKEMIAQGLPTLGTCAGMILLAKHLTNQEQSHMQLMDIDVKRNAYGRQLGSFFTNNTFADRMIPMTFIRAPFINRVGHDVNILSTVDGHIVAARQKHMLATAFHPELTGSTYVHEYFLQMIGHGSI